MNIHQVSYGSIKGLTADLGAGVHVITGPSGSGKTTMEKSLAWVFVGSAASKVPKAVGTKVELSIPGIGIVKRELTHEGEVVSACTEDGEVVDDAQAWIRGLGFLPQAIMRGARCMVGEIPKEPPAEIEQGGKRYILNTLSAESLRDKHQRLFTEYAELQAAYERRGTVQKKVEEELNNLRAELVKLKEQEGIQTGFSLLHLMNTGECPLYQVSCACKDQNIPKVKDDLKARLKDKKEWPEYFRAVQKLENDIAERIMYLRIVNERQYDGNERNLEEQMEEVRRKLEESKTIITALERRDKWRRDIDEWAPVVAIRDEIVASARMIGLNLSYQNGFKLNGVGVDQASRTERVVLDYVVQKATGAPVIMVDNFDAPDAAWKARLLKDAGNTLKTVVFFASSTAPRVVSGASCWHLENGRLARSARAFCAGQTV